METINDVELIMVFTVFRHGDKTPLALMPNDPNKNCWPDGLGSLTNEGKRQAYELGKAYRQQYDGFLSSDYKSHELYVYSTDKDRCLMSAQCCLAGMYPPKGDQLWNANLPWQPIPVHTNSAKTDPHHVDTATLRPELPNNSTKPRHIEIYENLTIKYKMRSGLPYVLPPNVDVQICDTLISECLELLTGSSPIIETNGIAMMDSVLTAIDGQVDGSNKTKMYIYSMHDMNIMSAMSLLNLDKVERPGNCGHCTFELYKDRASDTYYVKLLWRSTCNSKLVELPLEGNLPYISLDAFQQMVRASQKLVKNP